jgi:hypothetical protein
MAKKNRILKAVAETTAVGAGSMIGMSVIGNLGGISGIPAGTSKDITTSAGLGFGMLGTAQLLKNTGGIFDEMKLKRRKHHLY